jgi:hypothetical protein
MSENSQTQNGNPVIIVQEKKGVFPYTFVYQMLYFRYLFYYYKQ